MPKPLGPQSSALRFANLDGRTKEARLAAQLRRELIEHLGGSPSATEMLLIDQAAMIQVHIALLDKQKTATGMPMTTHDRDYYLAYCNSLSRLLRQIGLKGAPKPKRSLADHIAERP